ncbi:XRE family transcriptional regulator [Microbacterium yannicii]|uniref:XRE family transcriptional regulator n=1 Tax=Microbacterium yannicii TaxID=671622 RepID=UPI00030ECE6A|nr:XRE family transcriptional regulator [Microbacterium yannicii]
MQSDREATVLRHVGENLRRLRAEAGLSQAALAKDSGVSRRTIISLEAGEANISLSALDRLADALDTTFATLVAERGAPRTAIDEITWRGAHPSSVGVLHSSSPAAREVQLWTWALAPGDRYDAEPDPAGWSEMVVATAGRLTIQIEDSTLTLDPGEHATYASDQQYSYLNATEGPVTFVRIVIA